MRKIVFLLAVTVSMAATPATAQNSVSWRSAITKTRSNVSTGYLNNQRYAISIDSNYEVYIAGAQGQVSLRQYERSIGNINYKPKGREPYAVTARQANYNGTYFQLSGYAHLQSIIRNADVRYLWLYSEGVSGKYSVVLEDAQDCYWLDQAADIAFPNKCLF